MTIHPFLLKQGFKSKPEQPEDAWEFGGFQVVGECDTGELEFVTISNTAVITKENIPTGQIDLVSSQYESYYRYVEYLRREGKFDMRFNAVRNKWSIPEQHPMEFFMELSNGKNAVVLRNVISSPELKSDIRELCQFVHMNPDVPEQRWVVTAYLLFGELIFELTGSLLFLSIHSTRVFKIRDKTGIQMALEIWPSLNSYDWNKLLNPIRQLLRQQNCFVQGDGLVGTFKDVFRELAPKNYKECYVYNVPPTIWTWTKWRKEYRAIRDFLDSKVGEIYYPRLNKTIIINSDTNETMRVMEAEYLPPEKTYEKYRVIQDAIKTNWSEGSQYNTEFFKLIADILGDSHTDYALIEGEISKIMYTARQKRFYGSVDPDPTHEYENEEYMIDPKNLDKLKAVVKTAATHCAEGVEINSTFYQSIVDELNKSNPEYALTAEEVHGYIDVVQWAIRSKKKRKK